MIVSFAGMIITLFSYLFFVAIGFFLLLCVFILVFTKPYPTLLRHKEEKYFQDENGTDVIFPSINDSASLHLSIVVPAYDEELRLPPMLDECLEFLEKRNDYQYEIIIVSDGSNDSTVSVAQNYANKYGSEKIRVLNLIENRGKGGAVRLGVMSSRGALVLFADADGATKFSDLSKLEAALKIVSGEDYLKQKNVIAEKLGIVIGSRAHLQDDAVANRSFFRTILMYGFHFLVWLFTVRGIKDTQCGFKLLTREAARKCFSNMHVERWAFDVELLYIAQQFNIVIAEVSVNWTEIDGSKITPIWSWLQMGRDLFLIWLRYKLGAWKLRKTD